MLLVGAQGLCVSNSFVSEMRGDVNPVVNQVNLAILADMWHYQDFFIL